MTRKYIKDLLIILICTVALLMLVLFAVTWILNAMTEGGTDYPHGGIAEFTDNGNFEIDPSTILSDLRQGKTDVFESILTTPAVSNTPMPSGSYPWSQADYLLIAGALHQFVWNESVDRWNLYSLVFYRDCQDNQVGFDYAEISYFKQLDKSGYTVHTMQIDPLGGTVSWGGGGDFPHPFIFGWKSINLGMMHVTADSAIKLAEEHGGKEFRQRFNDSCHVDYILKPNPDGDDNWDIYYDNAGSLHTFEMYVNPYWGTYRILPGK